MASQVTNYGMICTVTYPCRTLADSTDTVLISMYSWGKALTEMFEWDKYYTIFRRYNVRAVPPSKSFFNKKFVTYYIKESIALVDLNHVCPKFNLSFK